MLYFPEEVTRCFLVSDGYKHLLYLNTNGKGKIEFYFSLWYSSHFTDKFLRVYRLKCTSLVMRIFFSNTLKTFLIFPKNAFSRASIGTCISTRTFPNCSCASFDPSAGQSSGRDGCERSQVADNENRSAHFKTCSRFKITLSSLIF